MNKKTLKSAISICVAVVFIGIIFLIYRYTDIFQNLYAKIFKTGSNDNAQSEEFDRDIYVGMYYFDSETTVIEYLEGYYTDTPVSTSVREIGDKVGDKTITKDNYATFEIRKDTYKYTIHYPFTAYTSGEWSKDNFHENMFNFYNNGGVLVISAEIVENKIIITDTSDAGVGKRTTTMIFVKE